MLATSLAIVALAQPVSLPHWPKFISWNPDGKSLIVATKDELIEWPSNRRIRLPAAPENSQVRSPDGSKLALTLYEAGLYLLDTKEWRGSIHRQNAYAVAWSTEGLITLSSPYGDRPQTLTVGAQTVEPKKTLYSMDDSGKIFVGTSDSENVFESRWIVYKRQGKRFESWKRSAKTYVEYPWNGNVAYDAKSDQAAFLMTGDTGATNWHLVFAGSQANRIILPPYIEGSNLYGDVHSVQWVSRGALVATTWWNQLAPGAKFRSGVRFVDPRGRSRWLLSVTSVMPWDEWMRRTTPKQYPSITLAAYSESGRSLAYTYERDGKHYLKVVPFEL